MQRLRVRFLADGVLSADELGERLSHAEVIELALDTHTAAAGDERRDHARALEDRERFRRSRAQGAGLFRVEDEPLRVRLLPAVARQADSLVGPVPVRRVRLREELAREVDPVGREETLVGAKARLRGVEQRPVPVEEDRSELQRRSMGTKSRSPGPM